MKKAEPFYYFLVICYILDIFLLRFVSARAYGTVYTLLKNDRRPYYSNYAVCE